MSDYAADERESTRQFWGSRRVLVTGGNGFLGSHILDRLDRQTEVAS